ncbi:hypothetical protein Gpo141_00004188 [Globisporangium polare]
MAKWQSASSFSSQQTQPPPAPNNSGSSCATGRPLLLHRVRSGSLNALDKPPMRGAVAAASPSTPTGEEDSSDDDEQQRAEEARESPASMTMMAAAMAIPQFRSCHVSSNQASGGGSEWRVRRRGRSVSDNSSCSTNSLSSIGSTSSGASAYSSTSSSDYYSIAGRPSLQKLSADVSAFRSGSMDSDDSMDGSLLGSVVVAPVLPRPPYPVDPYHFYCKPHLATGSVLSDMTTLLNDCDVEYSLHAFKCKFKCVKYVHYSHVEFIVRVYTHQNALLVEFQRRSGSLLLWDGLYNILYHKLVDLIEPSAPACPQSGGQKKVGIVRRDSLSAQIWRTISSETPSSGVEAMKIMLTSKYVDAQREGCSGLAVLTEDAQSSFLVAKHDLVGVLVSAAESDDLDMARCAVGALANISNAIGSFSSQQVADETVEQVKRAAKVVLERLAKTSDTRFSLELLRECARALCSFGKICPQQIVACDGSARLQLHANHRDAQLAAHCREALMGLQLNV